MLDPPVILLLLLPTRLTRCFFGWSRYTSVPGMSIARLNNALLRILLHLGGFFGLDSTREVVLSRVARSSLGLFMIFNLQI